MAKEKPYRFLLYLFARAFAAVLGGLPRPVLLALARRGGHLAFYIVARQRDKTLEHLRLVYGNSKTEKEINAIALKVFENLALTAADVLLFPKWTRKKILETVDYNRVPRIYDALFKEGKGLISITAHLGNWELLAAAFSQLGYEGAVVARRIYYEPYHRWVQNLRASQSKFQVIYRDESPKAILKVLKRNQLVGMLPDQDVDSVHGIFVPFLGRLAYTPVAPARMAYASGAPILPNFLVRIPGDRYQVVAGEVIRPHLEAPRDEEVERMTCEWSRQYEEVIRKYPEQWVWMHPRWKTTPESLKREKVTL